MKSLRVWLLVLLALALPIRGAMAGAMACAPSQGHVHAAAGAAHAGEHQHADAATQSHAHHEDGATARQAGSDSCSSCATCCSVTIPVFASLVFAQGPPASVEFPEALAPAAEFFADGPERPPRTI